MGVCDVDLSAITIITTEIIRLTMDIIINKKTVIRAAEKAA